MVRNIQSLAQLKLEIDKLSGEQQLRERELSNHIKAYANSLKPINLVKSTFSSLTNDPEMKGILKSKGVEAIIGFVVSQLLFKHSNPLVRTAVSVLGTTFATKVFGEQSSKYVEKLRDLYRKFRAKGSSARPGLFNEEDIYTA